MQTVKKSSLGEIKSVFNSSTENEQYYNILSKINNEESRLEFAKPIIQINSGYVLWKSNAQGIIKNYSEIVDEDVKRNLSNAIQEEIKKLESIFNNNYKDEEIFSKIIELPSEDSIYYSVLTDGKITIILTEWGFNYDKYIKTTGILKKVFPESLQSCVVKFVSNNGNLLPKIRCNINSPKIELTNQISDESGIVRVNGVSRGDIISINNIDSNFENKTFTIDNKETYTIVVERFVELNFKVSNSIGQPVIDNKFIFVSDSIGKKEFITDSLGTFNINHKEENGTFKIYSENDDKLLEELIPSLGSEYEIKYDPPITEEETPQIFENEETIEEKKPIVFEILNSKRKPIANKDIKIYGLSKGNSFKTDGNGQFTIDNLKANYEYAIFLEFKKTEWKKEFTHKDESEKYTFIVKMKKLFWWWIPLLLFILLLASFIPYNVNHNYTVLDKNTKSPLENATISSNVIGEFQTNLVNEATNKEGYLKQKYGRSSVFDQFFNKIETNISVNKNGYENLSTNVPLGFFKTSKSIVYLEPIFINLPDDTPILPCGGENVDETGQQIKKFDLGKSNSSFLFEFYNDFQADVIIVYCEDGSELFRYSDATETRDFLDSVILNAPCRYIYVKVIGTSNWGIRVNCPK